MVFRKNRRVRELSQCHLLNNTSGWTSVPVAHLIKYSQPINLLPSKEAIAISDIKFIKISYMSALASRPPCFLSFSPARLKLLPYISISEQQNLILAFSFLWSEEMDQFAEIFSRIFKGPLCSYLPLNLIHLNARAIG